MIKILLVAVFFLAGCLSEPDNKTVDRLLMSYYQQGNKTIVTFSVDKIDSLHTAFLRLYAYKIWKRR